MDDWITADKALMNSTLDSSLDSDSTAQLTTRVEADKEGVSEGGANLQRGAGTIWADRLHPSAIIPQDQQKRQRDVPHTSYRPPPDGSCRRSHIAACSRMSLSEQKGRISDAPGGTRSSCGMKEHIMQSTTCMMCSMILPWQAAFAFMLTVLHADTKAVKKPKQRIKRREYVHSNAIQKRSTLLTHTRQHFHTATATQVGNHSRGCAHQTESEHLRKVCTAGLSHPKTFSKWRAQRPSCVASGGVSANYKACLYHNILDDGNSKGML